MTMAGDRGNTTYVPFDSMAAFNHMALSEVLKATGLSDVRKGVAVEFLPKIHIRIADAIGDLVHEILIPKHVRVQTSSLLSERFFSFR